MLLTTVDSNTDNFYDKSRTVYKVDDKIFHTYFN